MIVRGCGGCGSKQTGLMNMLEVLNTLVSMYHDTSFCSVTCIINTYAGVHSSFVTVLYCSFEVLSIMTIVCVTTNTDQGAGSEGARFPHTAPHRKKQLRMNI